MKQTRLLIVLLLLGISVTGCAYANQPVTGYLFSDVKGPLMGVSTGDTPKTGEACAQSILGWIGQGDASIEAAKKAGGIKDVVYVDHHSTSILGVFAKFCTIVRGR